MQDSLHHVHRRSRDVPETIGFALPLCKQKAMQWLSIWFSLDYIRDSKYCTKAVLTSWSLVSGHADAELRSCVKVEVTVPNSPHGKQH